LFSLPQHFAFVKHLFNFFNILIYNCNCSNKLICYDENLLEIVFDNKTLAFGFYIPVWSVQETPKLT